MRENRIIHHVRDAFRGMVYQNLAILFCVFFGMAIIVNVELAGNPMWFWYATLFHGGAKLYADLHMALQPLFVLELNAWMQLAGNRVLEMEILSVIHLLALCLGIQLLARESTCPDWQKGILLASTFLVFTHFTAYLFDDYHVLSDIFWIYSFVFLLMLARADAVTRQLGLAATLGVISGLTITLRLNDGAALMGGTGVCLLVLARKKKLMAAGLFVAMAALTVGLILKTTGDSFPVYVSNSIVKAVGSKGGVNSILTYPFLLFRNALEMRHGRKWISLWFVAIVAVGALIQRYWKYGVKYIVVVQLGIAGAAFAYSSPSHRDQLLAGTFISSLSFLVIVVIYFLAPLVSARYLMWRTGAKKHPWDAREILVLPLLFWMAAGSASTAGNAEGFFPMMSLLFVLVMVIEPVRQHARWANLSMMTVLVLLGLSSVTTKIPVPFEWHHYIYSPMFENRQWYRHPVYGPMYIERDQLQLNESICEEIGQSNSRPELLSLPFPYPNYFCAIPPWHGYLNTFFDTSTRSTIVRLMQELQSAPPQWIVYQRQLKIMRMHEEFFNHGQPLAQRDLDELIMQKIATGEWQIVAKNNYFPRDNKNYFEGDGWLIIRTRP